MRSGELDRTVVIQSNTPTQDASGGEVDSWATVATVPAKVTPTPGGERFTGFQRAGFRLATFKIRYRTGVNVKQRVQYDSHDWDILDVQEIGRREALLIVAETRAE